jgi:hypothetical protein
MASVSSMCLVGRRVRKTPSARRVGKHILHNISFEDGMFQIHQISLHLPNHPILFPESLIFWSDMFAAIKDDRWTALSS